MAITIRKLGSGKYGDVFLVSDGATTMAMRVSFYRDDSVTRYVEAAKDGDAKKADEAKSSDAVAVANAFSAYVKGLMDTVSPHFVYQYFQIDIKNFAERMPLLSERLKNLTALQKKYNNVAFMEAFTCDMTKYLQTALFDEHDLRCMIFQVLYTIAAMQHLLRGWRHNDLSTNNVLVKILRRPLALAYTISPLDQTYHAVTPVLLALNDYDFLHVPNHPEFQNFRVTGGRFKVNEEHNQSYDVHFFLKSVLRCIAKKPQKEFPATTRFFKSLGLKDEDRQNKDIPSLHPLRVLTNEYFQILKHPITIEHHYAF